MNNSLEFLFEFFVFKNLDTTILDKGTFTITRHYLVFDKKTYSIKGNLDDKYYEDTKPMYNSYNNKFYLWLTKEQYNDLYIRINKRLVIQRYINIKEKDNILTVQERNTHYTYNKMFFNDISKNYNVEYYG